MGMDWRSLLPHALVGGAVVGFLVGVVVAPWRWRVYRKRSRERLRQAREAMEGGAPVRRPPGTIARHAKWNRDFKHPPWYYTGSED